MKIPCFQSTSTEPYAKPMGRDGMNPMRQISAILRRMESQPKHPVEQAIRESDIALERKIDAMRKVEGPEAAAMAAAGVAAEAEKKAKDAELNEKIAKASAKSARKIANKYRKGASKAAASASAAEADAAAKDATATRMSQSAAVDRAEVIISEEQRKA